MEEYRRCPYCDELVRYNAIKCKHCGSVLTNSQNISTGIITPETQVRMALSFKYEILEEIGRGGMASVYKATQKNLNRLVALKVIHQNLVHDNEFLQRFHQEAQLAASLNHPNIITIHDEGAINNIHYMAMEYLSGNDLHRIIKYSKKINIEDSIKITISIANALDHAHIKGLIHRDIKSANIIITNEGRAVLTDFGIAFAANRSKLTQTGSLIGTPEYMSPEQAKGILTDNRSDIYSLGIVMFECLTGEVPFTGDNPLTTIYKIINEKPRLAKELNKEVPHWLSTVVNKALEKDPQTRFQTGKEFAASLREKKKVDFTEKQFVSPRTKKIKLKEKKIQNSQEESLNQIQKKELKDKKIRPLRNDNPKVVYFIGGVIIILLFAIAAMLFKDFNFGGRNIEESIKDSQWASLSEPDRKQVLSLIESGDDLFDNNNLLQPEGNNAFEKYKAVLAIHSSNVYATNQLDKIFREVFNKASNDLNNGNTVEANSIIAQIKHYFPEQESELASLSQTNEESSILNESGQILARSDLSLNDLSQVYAKVSLVLNKEPENEIAKGYLRQLEEKYSQLGESYSNSGQIPDAIQVYQEAKEYFVSNSTFNKRLIELERKIEAESQVIVPNVIGKSESEAVNHIISAKLQANIFRVSTAKDKGKVIEQNPPGGSKARRGSAVNITYNDL